MDFTGAGGHQIERPLRMAVAAREGERGARRSLSLRFVVLPLSIVAAAAAIVFAAPYLYAEGALHGVTITGLCCGALEEAAISRRRARLRDRGADARRPRDRPARSRDLPRRRRLGIPRCPCPRNGGRDPARSDC